MNPPALKSLSIISSVIVALGFIIVGPSSVRADELDDITKAGVLKVGLFEDLPPFASAGPDLKLHGYDIDVIDALNKALGTHADLVGITGQNRIPFLTEHKIDVVLSIGKTDERAKIVDFTDAYAPYFIAVWGPKSISVKSAADLANKSVAVPRGTLEDSSLTQAAPASTNIQRYNDYDGVISAVLSGQAQLMVIGNDVGASVIAKHPAIEPEEKFQLLSSPSCLAINKNEPRLLQKLNETIAMMRKDGSLNALSQKWLLQPLPSDF
jgi:polar amino acid transport system substrate-binding protein